MERKNKKCSKRSPLLNSKVANKLKLRKKSYEKLNHGCVTKEQCYSIVQACREKIGPHNEFR